MCSAGSVEPLLKRTCGDPGSRQAQLQEPPLYLSRLCCDGSSSSNGGSSSSALSRDAPDVGQPVGAPLPPAGPTSSMELQLLRLQLLLQSPLASLDMNPSLMENSPSIQRQRQVQQAQSASSLQWAKAQLLSTLLTELRHRLQTDPAPSSAFQPFQPDPAPQMQAETQHKAQPQPPAQAELLRPLVQRWHSDPITRLLSLLHRLGPG